MQFNGLSDYTRRTQNLVDKSIFSYLHVQQDAIYLLIFVLIFYPVFSPSAIYSLSFSPFSTLPIPFLLSIFQTLPLFLFFLQLFTPLTLYLSSLLFFSLSPFPSLPLLFFLSLFLHSYPLPSLIQSKSNLHE
jgi:hypothetical protein